MESLNSILILYMKKIVNSYNEWDKLEEVIVGCGIPTNIPAIDFTFKMFFHDNLIGINEFRHEILKKHIDEHNEDIESFAELLKSLGVIVKRPKVPDKIHKVKTHSWNSEVHPSLNVRDLTVVIGDEIIETPPSCRWRYYETDFMKHLFLDYFNNGAKWTQVPKPIITDMSFDMSYIEKTGGIINRKESYMDCGYEIMFDAANMMRFGKHILFNCSNENSRMGMKWLQRHLGDKHIVWGVDICDNHIDSSILPLKPGLCIVTREDFWHKLPAPLQKWDKIYIPQLNRTTEEFHMQGIKLASPRIELNVFSVSPELVICHPNYEKILNQKLNPHGISAIGSRMRHCEIFSGAHHCTTLDIRRDGIMEDYFT
jgi:glycine amidinotransferase